MTQADRGGPCWIRRSTREHFPCAAPTWEKNQGNSQGLGNWSRSQQGGHQLIGGASFGSGLTSTPNSILNVQYGTPPSKSLIDFGYWGPKVWQRYQPLNPKVSTSQFFAELRDFPKLVFRMYTKLRFYKELGEDYLNFEFGWKPFIKDFVSFFTEWLKIDDRIKALIKNNGKPIHREGTFSDTIDTTSSRTSGVGADILSPTYETAAYVAWFGSSTSLPWSKEITTTTSQKVWFSGTFVYHLQPFGTMRFQEEIARIIYGFDLTPRLLWELMPWSWLIDWCTSFGSSLNNLVEVNLDNLVAEYAYCMDHYTVKTETVWSNGLGSASFVQTDEIKARAQATPFGFGLSPLSFTTRQNAILAALVLARS